MIRSRHGAALFVIGTASATLLSVHLNVLSEIFLTAGFLLPGCTSQSTDRKMESGSLWQFGFLHSSPAAPQPL